MSHLHSYTTLVSVDHFGNYPGMKPGAEVVEMYEGKVYILTMLDGPITHRPNGSMLRDAHIQIVEGPVTRQFMPFEVRHQNWRKYTKRKAS